MEGELSLAYTRRATREMQHGMTRRREEASGKAKPASEEELRQSVGGEAQGGSKGREKRPNKADAAKRQVKRKD